MTKSELRAKYLKKRSMLDKTQKRQFDLEIQSRLLMSDVYSSARTVLLYVSNDSEIDTYGIINAAFANKKRVAVPVTNDDYSLTFYYINSLEELKFGRFNILEPTSTDKVTDFLGSICIVPSLCCDLSFNRLGYGKGCYDRFLSTYDGTKICLTYADFVLPQIECDSTDVKVDMIVTNQYVKNT